MFEKNFDSIMKTFIKCRDGLIKLKERTAEAIDFNSSEIDRLEKMNEGLLAEKTKFDETIQKISESL